MILKGTCEKCSDDQGRQGMVFRIPALNYISGTDHLTGIEEICSLVREYIEGAVKAQSGRLVSVPVLTASETEFLIDASEAPGEILSLIIMYQRMHQGLSQREMAKRAGVGHSGVAHYENGDREPGFEKMDSLMRALGLRLVVSIEPDRTCKNSDRLKKGA